MALLALVASVHARFFNETRVMTFNVLCQACVGDNYQLYARTQRPVFGPPRQRWVLPC